LRRQGRWDYVAAMFTVNPKIPVQGQHAAFGMPFGHAHQAGIGQGHGHLRIPPQECAHGPRFLLQCKCKLDDPSVEQFENGLASARERAKQILPGAQNT
jgi:hypothetical protein